MAINKHIIVNSIIFKIKMTRKIDQNYN